ncbi:ferredoxin reductase [Nakamurella sp. YIM 132087]|uniref:Ferredoxin reductase n=1 Tax=Nakamurella alba TaxID=2665158 RepID=A0A7K1FGA7_9ACTN|nr:FAD-dependent oxidoreductase [Nakamurella alba]MTD12519.1 ferredoxin reductase [Nakamurella alba]
MTTGRVVVVGGGHAGAALAGLLRQGGYDGEITVLSAETDPPYHRPPLSKKFTDAALEQWLRPAEFWPEQRIDLRLGTTATAIDRRRHRVELAGGGSLDYDHLVLATGARPRELPVPGADLDGVIGLRTLSHARELRRLAGAGSGHLVIIGGGYIGLEVAAVARSAGTEVTVLERESRLLARVASDRLSEILARYHSRAGTRVVTRADVAGFVGEAGRVRAVRLGDGSEIACDAVLVGVGAVPADELAVAAGLGCEQGVLVDECARTSDPKVLAIGDVTRRPVLGLDGLRRLESIPSGTEQARQACSVVLGTAAPAPEVPWFWSDQNDLKIKIAGVVVPGTAVVLRGSPDEGRFALYHHVGGVVTAAETANAPADFMAAKKFIAAGSRIDPALLADLSVRVQDAVLTSEEASCPP